MKIRPPCVPRTPWPSRLQAHSTAPPSPSSAALPQTAGGLSPSSATHNLVRVDTRAHNAQPHFAAGHDLLLAVVVDVAGLVGGAEAEVLGDEVVGHKHLQRPRLRKEPHLQVAQRWEQGQGKGDASGAWCGYVPAVPLLLFAELQAPSELSLDRLSTAPLATHAAYALPHPPTSPAPPC